MSHVMALDAVNRYILTNPIPVRIRILDNFIILGALLGAIIHIAAYGIYEQHVSKVIAAGLSNGLFAFCLGMLTCKIIRLSARVEQDHGLSLAVSCILALLTPWALHMLAPETGKKVLSIIGKKLQTAWKSFNLRSLVARWFDLSEKK